MLLSLGCSPGHCTRRTRPFSPGTSDTSCRQRKHFRFRMAEFSVRGSHAMAAKGASVHLAKGEWCVAVALQRAGSRSLQVASKDLFRTTRTGQESTVEYANNQSAHRKEAAPWIRLQVVPSIRSICTPVCFLIHPVKCLEPGEQCAVDLRLRCFFRVKDKSAHQEACSRLLGSTFSRPRRRTCGLRGT